MSNNFSDFSEVLKFIVENNGKDILKDKNKTNAIISDLAPGDNFRGEKKLLNAAYSCNAVSILINADTDPDRRGNAFKAAKEKLEDDFISPDGADIIVKSICSALGWNMQDFFSKPTAQPQNDLRSQEQESITPQPVVETVQQEYLQSACENENKNESEVSPSSIGSIVRMGLTAAGIISTLLGGGNQPKQKDNENVSSANQEGDNEKNRQKLLTQTAALLNEVIDVKKQLK